jgi:microsomal dipeptidase-like Zn-dependent dipeptidase
MKSTLTGFETVADLQIITPELEKHGYSAADVEPIMNGNWVRELRGVLAV